MIVYLFTTQKPDADNDFELLDKKQQYKNQLPDASDASIFAKIIDYKGAILQAVALFTLTYVLI